MFDIQSVTNAGSILAIVLIFLIVFAESGLLIGFFLPGDTLLFAAGLAASQGSIPLPALLFFTIMAAIIGDNVGYSIGRRAGKRIFKKKDGILFRSEYLERAEEFYEKHGGKTIVLARFTPIVRTFAPVVAGAGKMPRRKFFFYNVAGGIFWVLSMTLLGYYVGSQVPHLDEYIEIVLVSIVALSLLLAAAHVLKDKQTRAKIMQKIKLGISNIGLNKRVD